MSNGLDPDQDRHYVGPDLHLNRLQRLSRKKTEVAASKEKVITADLAIVLSLIFRADLILWLRSSSLTCRSGCAVS